MNGCKDCNYGLSESELATLRAENAVRSEAARSAYDAECAAVELTMDPLEILRALVAVPRRQISRYWQGDECVFCGGRVIDYHGFFHKPDCFVVAAEALVAAGRETR